MRTKVLTSNTLRRAQARLCMNSLGRFTRSKPVQKNPKKVDIRVAGDFAGIRPRFEKVGSRIVNAAISPTGIRAVFEARGEIISAPRRQRRRAKSDEHDERDGTRSVVVAGRTLDCVFFRRIGRIYAPFARPDRNGRCEKIRARRRQNRLLFVAGLVAGQQKKSRTMTITSISGISTSKLAKNVKVDANTFCRSRRCFRACVVAGQPLADLC